MRQDPLTAETKIAAADKFNLAEVNNDSCKSGLAEVPDDTQRKSIDAYPKAAEFIDRFKEKNASYVCREMLGCDISSEEGMLYARENDLFMDICPQMVESAVDILEEMEL